MLSPGVGYVALTGGFADSTAAEFRQAMNDLKAQGMQRLVLDLRSNPGGLLKAALAVASEFLPRDSTVYSVRSRAETEIRRSENDTPITLPVLALVNRYTASSAEVLLGALQDHDRAVVAGETTYGKGLVQKLYDLEGGTQVKLTIATYQTPSGRLLQRDYSHIGLYDYYRGAGSGTQNGPAAGLAYRSDAGHVIYGGGGITPDISVKWPATDYGTGPASRAKFSMPMFDFALRLAYGRIKGFENYKVAAHNTPLLTKEGCPQGGVVLSDACFYDEFKTFAVAEYKIAPEQIDLESDYIKVNIRRELAIITQGPWAANQILSDPELKLIQQALH
jgi:carboxyl-terminal processing protease